ncbi:MAG: hypothetical protein M0T74_01255 [Desulfitobacterium hafniense]|nr:hypothetical protein [Desulfitobacterium hafniense]
MAKINERIALSEQAAKTSEKEVEKNNHHDDDQQGPSLPDAEKVLTVTFAIRYVLVVSFWYD